MRLRDIITDAIGIIAVFAAPFGLLLIGHAIGL